MTGVLSPEQFLSILKGTFAFLDPFVTNRHGAETHRIQWWMIARDMQVNADAYDAATASQLFASTADDEAFDSPGYNVWYHCLDALQGKCTTGRAPENLKEYINTNFPKIAAAEAMQMKWDTCVKWRYDKVKGQQAVTRMKNEELKQFGP